MKRRTSPTPANRERLTEDNLLRKLLDLLFRYRGLVRSTILKNIALLTHAWLTLFHGARGGNGWLSQAAVARCLPLEIGPKGRRPFSGQSQKQCPRLLPGESQGLGTFFGPNRPDPMLFRSLSFQAKDPFEPDYLSGQRVSGNWVSL